MRATRAASEAVLVDTALPRLDALLAEGVTTVEVKSSYGLDTDSEIRMLRAARRLGEVRDVRVSTTFLGAHALPPDYEGDADAYIAHVVDAMPPQVARLGLADAVDAFCETSGLTAAPTGRLLESATSSGLPGHLPHSHMT